MFPPKLQKIPASAARLLGSFSMSEVIGSLQEPVEPPSRPRILCKMNVSYIDIHQYVALSICMYACLLVPFGVLRGFVDRQLIGTLGATKISKMKTTYKMKTSKRKTT